MLFLFDVDGTLTPSRKKIDYKFSIFLSNFFLNYDCYIVTGSDKPRTVEQLGQVYNLAHMSFQCSGNQIWKGDNLIRESKWKCPDDLRALLEKHISKSNFDANYRTGYHIEERPGSINFSILGRKSSNKGRQEYIFWDEATEERERIALDITNRFPEISAVVGGETGIDIFPKNKDKQQVLDYLPKDQEILFFGDRMNMNGNDYSLAKVIENTKRGKSHHVSGWENTRDILQQIYSEAMGQDSRLRNRPGII